MSVPATPGFAVQGWCPGALRPMTSGDGLVVRLRPTAGRLTSAQAAGIAASARAHGNGLIDLSARANVQLRGVTPESHAPLINDLRQLGLIDADAQSEARRNLLVTPFADKETDALAMDLAQSLQHMPALPGKFGFAIDTGPATVLQATPADIRLERDAEGRLILRADGASYGATVSRENAASATIALAHWFVENGGIIDGRGRMAALIARGFAPVNADCRPAASAPVPSPGLIPLGALVGFEFGQMTSETLAALAAMGDLRVTPWRMLLVEGQATMPNIAGLITRADDPLRRVQACTGAPGCLQAHAPVRPLARRLAAQVPPGKTLHVSGCAKGCAHPARADFTIVAVAAGFDLILDGTAQDGANHPALPEAEIDLKGLM